MTLREAFSTGKPHQSAVATWARVRLADRGGCRFDDGTGHETPQQAGCLFADGVGLGKTWEALAAVALLLDKHARIDGKGGVNQRQRRAHVIILLPPGLVAKWYSELDNPQGFPERLKGWAQRGRGRREFIKRTLEPESCFLIRYRRDLDSLPRRGYIKYRKYTLPAGTYLCNWNVFLGPGGRGRDRVTALKNQQWDVVVVDEAHNRRARAALDKFWHEPPTLLLTATPFQLDMTELHGLTKHLVEGKAAAHRVLKRGAVRDYVKAADHAFDGGRPPTSAERRGAQAVLGQLIARSRVGRQKRLYFAIDAAGVANRVGPPTELEAANLTSFFDTAIRAPSEFSQWYLQQRLKLARREADDTPRYVAVELRKLLSVKKPPAPPAPRLNALRTWAQTQFLKDLQDTMRTGCPRKLLVFTYLKTNVAGVIKESLEEALQAAHQELARSQVWRDARRAAPAALASVIDEIKMHAPESLHKRLDRFAPAIQGSLVFDLFGNKRFARKAKRELLTIVGAEELTTRARASQKDTEWLAQQQRVKESTALALLEAVAKAPLAATFTGDDTRRERDATAEAFKTALAPWILVATNVGAEGIDLQTYSRHLVHFDLEWNPARMEQREGRIDRFGRALKEPARIYYLLVKDTYDERMFHQMIARQRWHGVLLGRKALQLAKANSEAPLRSPRETANMSLDLDPRYRD